MNLHAIGIFITNQFERAGGRVAAARNSSGAPFDVTNTVYNSNTTPYIVPAEAMNSSGTKFKVFN